MNKLKKIKLVLIPVLLGLGFFVGRACAPDAPSGEAVPQTAAPAKPIVWTCSMHPQVRLPTQSQCPICFMDLIPANSGDGDDLGPRTLQLSETAAALADIETASVERRTVAYQVDLIGKVAVDETRLAYITSRVAGRLDRLYVDYTGVTVRANDHLVEIYSPTLYTAQQELLQAIQTVRRLDASSLDIVRDTSNRTVHSASEKLRLYGLSNEQLAEIVERGAPNEHITIYAPIGGVVIHKNAIEGMYVGGGTQIYTIADLTHVWILFDAYESDLAWLRYGQEVEFQVEAYPGEQFTGRIAFIDPLLDDSTRTVKVRLNVENTDGRLKPDMFVSGTAQAVLTEHGKAVDEDLAGKWMCPMHPEVVANEMEPCPKCGMDLVLASELGFVAQPEQGESLVIPATAPLITGKRAVVYVRVPDQEKPTFEGRVISLGPRAGDWYVVRDGLEEGELVVVKGNFKIDSELQIRAKPSMMSADAEEGEVQGAVPAAVRLETPKEFREQLGAILDPYVALQTSFSLDIDSQELAQAIVHALHDVDMGLLDEEAFMAWLEQLPELRDAAANLAAATDFEQRRLLLSPLTDRLVWALKTFGYETAGEDVGVFHCPMALDGEGADWLQLGEQTANPYYGSAMLRCGGLEESLPSGSSTSSSDATPVGAPQKFREQLGTVLDSYLELQRVFAADQDDPEMAQQIVTSLEAVDMGLLEGEAHAAWMKRLPALRKAAEQLAAAKDLESRRLLLSPLTESLVGALKIFGYRNADGQVGLFHCPMALDGEGANWIQVGETTANPYYGSMMLRCGSQTEVLEQGN